MGMLTVGASEVLHRYVYPPFVRFWSALGRFGSRAGGRREAAAKSAETRRRKTLWNRSHDR